MSMRGRPRGIPLSTRIRSAVTAAALAMLVAAGMAAVVAGSDDAQAVALAAAVEDEGADCPVPASNTINNSQLPDPFTKLDGTRIKTKADWRCRRAEIRELAERY